MKQETQLANKKEKETQTANEKPTGLEMLQEDESDLGK